MAQREVLILNESVPQAQVPQAGDTYYMPRPTEIVGTLTVSGLINGFDLSVLAGVIATALQPGGNVSDLVNDAGYTNDMTGAEIKAAYEAEPDTNAYVDTDKAKMDWISVTQAVDLDAMESAITALQNTDAANIAVTTGIVANPGGGFASAPELSTRYNVVATVATIADSVKLPTAVAGLRRTIRNAGANALDLFPGAGDNINSTGVDTAVSVAAGSSLTLFCADDTNWYSE